MVRSGAIPSGPSLPHSRNENAAWYRTINSNTDIYRRRFLSALFVAGLFLPAFVAVVSLYYGEHWNLLPLAAVETVLAVGLTASRLLPRRGVNILIGLLLLFYPPAYAWGAFAAGNHQTYIIVLLCMPPIFDSLSPRRWYWHWFSYAVAVVAAVLFSSFFGLKSSWVEDFSPRVIFMMHGAFLVLWALRHVTRLQMQKYTAELADNIVRDKATGLPTIVAFRDALEQRKNTFVSLVAVSNFRELSTLFGYSLSMEVLSIAAFRLAKMQESMGGKAFRLRGHDFGFIRGMAEGESPQDIVKILQRGLAGSMEFKDKTIELSYRIGYTLIADGNAERALDEAEEALDMAEENGLDSASYSGTRKKATEAEIHIADLMTLSSNISNNTMAVFYQPVVSLSSGKTAWNEALVRFLGSGESYEAPARFMALASTTGHWAAIEDFMFARAIGRACGEGGSVSVNIALKDLDREGFRSAIEAGARAARERGSAIILEILEGDFGFATPERLEALKSLRGAGCLIAFDDFGTGYSNYSRLLSMPVDIVKFDQSLVQSARGTRAEATLLQGVSRFCYDIGALTVAEGIETKELADFAAAVGFDFGQGYFWSRPVPEFEAPPAERTPLIGGKLARYASNP